MILMVVVLTVRVQVIITVMTTMTRIIAVEALGIIRLISRELLR